MRILMKEIWRILDGPPKNKELWSYVVKFEFSRPKSSSECQDGLKRWFLLVLLEITNIIGNGD